MYIENIEKLTGCNVHFQLIADRRLIQNLVGIRRDCDRMVVGFTTTYASSAYHH